ncbi:MAG: transposase [Chthoniobacterales bacterium]|nr:transposase [Chthoniobacterales bacterium]
MKKTTVRKQRKVTIGLDLGGRRHTYCVLDGCGEVIEQGSMASDRGALVVMARKHSGSTVIMEAGMHSPWVSRYLQGLGMKVVVANPRKVRAIYQNERKSDRRDAQMLARIGRMDVKLLHPVVHGSEEAQQDMVSIKLRDTLVRIFDYLECFYNRRRRHSSLGHISPLDFLSRHFQSHPHQLT